MDTSGHATTTDGSKGKQTAFLVLTILFGALIGGLLFALISLVFAWFETGDRLQHRVHDLGYAASVGLWIALPYLMQSSRSLRKIALMQMAGLAIVAMAIAVALSADWAFLGLVAIFAIVWAVLLWLHRARAQILPSGPGFNWLLAIIPVLVAVPLVIYAVDMVELQRTGLPTDSHVEERHWSNMGALAIGMVLIGLLAAFRTSGWRIVAWTVAGSAFVFGLSSVVFPDYPGAVGTTWGLVAIAGALLFVGVAELEARRTRTP